jgi:hypothetical protein
MTASPWIVAFDASASTATCATQIASLGVGTSPCVAWVVGSKVYVARCG